MAVIIEPTDVNTFIINQKEIHQDSEGNWIAKPNTSFTSSELRAWSNYKKDVIEASKPPIKITFKN